MRSLADAACVNKCLRENAVSEHARRVKEVPWRGGGTKAQHVSVGVYCKRCCGGLGCNIMRLTPDGSRLVGSGSNASPIEATVYNHDLTVKGVLLGRSTRVFSVATDGAHHATGHVNGNIQIWDAATLALVGELQHGLQGGMRHVLGLSIHADVLVSGSMDGTAKCWSISSQECHAVLHHDLSVNSVEVNEALIATASDDMTARLWAHRSASCRHVLRHAAEVNAVSLAPEIVVTGCYDTLVRIFDVCSGQLTRTLCGHTCEVLAVCARDGMIVSGAGDTTVRVWLEEEEEAVAVIRGHTASVNSVALAPGGRLVASMSSNGEVLTWCATCRALKQGCCPCDRF